MLKLMDKKILKNLVYLIRQIQFACSPFTDVDGALERFLGKQEYWGKKLKVIQDTIVSEFWGYLPYLF